MAMELVDIGIILVDSHLVKEACVDKYIFFSCVTGLTLVYWVILHAFFL